MLNRISPIFKHLEDTCMFLKKFQKNFKTSYDKFSMNFNIIFLEPCGTVSSVVFVKNSKLLSNWFFFWELHSFLFAKLKTTEYFFLNRYKKKNRGGPYKSFIVSRMHSAILSEVFRLKYSDFHLLTLL